MKLTKILLNILFYVLVACVLFVDLCYLHPNARVRRGNYKYAYTDHIDGSRTEYDSYDTWNIYGDYLGRVYYKIN